MASKEIRRRILRGTSKALRPPPKLTLSEWADKYYRMSAVSSAEPGRWRTLPYQREIMDAITDRRVEFVSLMKSARVGASKMINIALGYHIHYDPCTAMLVQPTVDDARGYSQDEIAPMLSDVDVLSELVDTKSATKKSGNTILRKAFPGGVLSLVGANSGTGFRRVSRRLVLLDEVDGYPASAGNEGDPVSLAIKRSAFYWNRKIFAASTPKNAGSSRIEEMFLAGDQRRYHVPCPHCGYMDILTFREQADRGHWMAWENDDPETAHMVCRGCGSSIGYEHQRAMLEAGEWRADAEFKGHASFHIWAAYSIAPDVTWPKLVKKFLEVKGNPATLQPFVNLDLGETWQERGEAPDWERLWLRGEDYSAGTVPGGVHFLTAGIDVQHDRIEYEVVGWALNKENWSVDTGILWGAPSGTEVWELLDDLLGRTFPGEDGQAFKIARMAVDSGAFTQEVYNWCRRYPMSRVMAVKGMPSSKARTLLSTPSPVDVKANGRRSRRAYKMWPVGVSIAKTEFYGWLKLPVPDTELDEEYPPGYCHFPRYDRDYFMQITAEQLMTVQKRDGFSAREWQRLPGRQNHRLDCRVYARAAASAEGLDRVVQPPPESQAKPSAPRKPAPEPQDTPRRERNKGGFLKGGFLKGGRAKGSWLGKRRR